MNTEELKKSQEPVMVELKDKAQHPKYQPTEEKLAKFIFIFYLYT